MVIPIEAFMNTLEATIPVGVDPSLEQELHFDMIKECFAKQETKDCNFAFKYQRMMRVRNWRLERESLQRECTSV